MPSMAFSITNKHYMSSTKTLQMPLDHGITSLKTDDNFYRQNNVEGQFLFQYILDASITPGYRMHLTRRSEAAKGKTR